jgi:hypothetical protein
LAKKAAAARKSGGARKASASKQPTSARGSQKRDLVKAKTGARYAKRKPGGQFKEMDDVGRSQTADRRQVAKKKVKSGYGDQGDRKKKARSGS